MAGTPARIWLSNYAPPPYSVERIDLSIELDTDLTTIMSRQTLSRRQTPPGSDLALRGRGFPLRRLAINDRMLEPHEYLIRQDELILRAPPEHFVLEQVTELSPRTNLSALGMFMDGPSIITHMEPDGLSRLFYCQDRPDVLSRYEVLLIADPARFPVLLSNGDLVGSGMMQDGRHFARWRDDIPKSSYIFAIAAGPYGQLSDIHVDGSGRSITLTIHAAEANTGRCRFLMDSLKRVMAWDEEAFGRRYDLDSLNVVVVDTHAISQENKGLIFLEAAYALADTGTSTDEDLDLVERIAGHEYLHNWTGNRVTCRDWFQLSVKEGLTRFRDQMFSAAMSSPDVKRIASVRALRTNQFTEDAGGGAHPVQPKSYAAVSNLYSTTVYDKGAEIVRMTHTILGPELFRAGLDLFFGRHDLSAVTIDDLLRSLEDATGQDLGQFARWYHQAGTPRVRVSFRQDPHASCARLELSQRVAVADQSGMPLRIPLRMALLQRDGSAVAIRDASGPLDLINLTEMTQAFDLIDVTQPVVLSCNRGFSAPVIVELERSPEDLALLLRCESDGFARWDAGQELMIRSVLETAGTAKARQEEGAAAALMAAFADILGATSQDRALAAELISFPHIGLVAESAGGADFGRLAEAWIEVRSRLALANRDELLAMLQACTDPGPVVVDLGARARRRLRAVCLEYLLETGDPAFRALALKNVATSASMTDQSAALHALCNFDCEERHEALDVFRDRWSAKPDVMRLWLRAQALSRYPGAAGRVRALAGSDMFDLSNAPQAMALLGSFFRQNRIGLHAGDGSGYSFLADMLLQLDRLRPQATRWLMPQLLLWRRFDPARAAMMKAQIERLAATPGISAALTENLERALGASRDGEEGKAGSQ